MSQEQNNLQSMVNKAMNVNTVDDLITPSVHLGELAPPVQNAPLQQQPTPVVAQQVEPMFTQNEVTEAQFEAMATVESDLDVQAREYQASSSLPPGVEDSIAAYEANMENDHRESIEVREKLKAANVNNGLVEHTDVELEKATPEEREEILKERVEGVEEEEEEDDEKIRKEFNEKYEASTVVIEKFGAGYLEFSEEEQEKIQNSKIIKVKEVEEISIDTLTIKRKRKSTIDTVLKRSVKANTVPIVLPASGYTAAVSGLSVMQIMSLLDQEDGGDLVAQTQLKWSIIHEHIEETSIGKMDFAEFMKNTVQSDYGMFIFGLLCATYPGDDKVILTCGECKKDYDHKYTLRSLIRTEMLSPELSDRLMQVIDASRTEEKARAIFNTSYGQQSKSFILPVSGFVFEVNLQSANDFINQTMDGMMDLDDARYQQAALLSSGVRRILIDESGDGEYTEFVDFDSITKTIYNLRDKDLTLLTKELEKMVDGKDVKFGFMNAECPHCKKYTPTLEVSVEQILFQHYQSAMTMEVE